MQKPKSFRPWQPDQTTLLPPSPREWLAEDHQVYFLLDLAEELHLIEPGGVGGCVVDVEAGPLR